jgi:L-asparaginase II
MSELLVEVIRGPLVESRHFGDVAVVDRHGNVLYAVGDPHRVTFARSTAKPVQALPLVESGAADHYGLTEEELAVVCASHSGEQMHEDVVRRLLARAGIEEDKLRCGIHPPYHGPAYETLLRAGRDVTAVHNNCSGKHAGMLVLARYLGADLDTYLQPDHPVQGLIVQALCDLAELGPDDVVVGVDGCGAPVFGLPLFRLALMYAKLADPAECADLRRKALDRIFRAMTRHPHLVAGTERFCTALMQAGKGRIVGKTGAEGVYCVGLKEQGIGIALKVDDGNTRAAYPAVVEVLHQLGVLDAQDLETLEPFWHPKLRNHQGAVVGHLRPRVVLKRCAS